MKKKIMISVAVVSAIVASIVAFCVTHYKEYAEAGREDVDELF